MYVRPAPLLLSILYVTLGLALALDDEQDKVQEALRVMEHLKETRNGLSKLQGVVDGIDKDLLETQKRTCSVGGGMSHHCAAAFLDSQLSMQDYLKTGESPGKRASQKNPSTSANSDLYRNKAKQWVSSSRFSPGKRSSSEPVNVGKLRDVQMKRKGMQIFKRILQEMDADLVTEQNKAKQWVSSSRFSPGKRSSSEPVNVGKRTCLVNLGGHCATESAASMADQWHYLNSPLSPGRKRRDTALYKKLVSGQLIPK